MLDAIDRFYFNHYCLSFRSGAFARANSTMYVCLVLHLPDSIIRIFLSPMLNMLGQLRRYVYLVLVMTFILNPR